LPHMRGGCSLFISVLVFSCLKILNLIDLNLRSVA
jgi:hypothetical protein